MGKKFAILFSFALFSLISFSQNTWTQKQDFGGTTRYGAAGFSIGTKGYIGTGYDGSNWRNDFWEYDQASNSWTQKANFGGTIRSSASGFSIGTKGYIGLGQSGPVFGDLWEYDPSANSWTQKTSFPGLVRYSATGLSIGSKGYFGLGTGGSSGPYYKDFWEYDPVGNTWTQKANFGGAARNAAIGFTIGSKGYVGAGSTVSTATYFSDLWEYDPSINTWTQKTTMPAAGRAASIAFAINSKGYVCSGMNFTTSVMYKDLWEFDPASNSWAQKLDFAGVANWGAVGFSIGNKGYLGTGNSGPYHKDFWEYSPAQSLPDSTCDASFTVSTHDCAGDGVNFYSADTSVGATHYWYFGSLTNVSPASSTQKDPTNIIFSQPGAYYVKHIITQGAICSDTSVQIITINPIPTASFTCNAPICQDKFVNFTNTGSSGVGYSYAWDLGAGANPQASSAQNPVGISYSFAGTKTITQYITNQFGCIAVKTGTISITPIPDASFSFTNSVCVSENVNFYSTTTAAVSHSWTFGANASPSTSTQANPANIVYSAAGSYYVTHIVNNGSCTDTLIQTITVNPSPAATFSSNAPVCVDAPVNFINTGSSGPGYSYSWDFGVGANPATSVAQSPTGIIYISGGTPKITQYITNQFGCTTINTGTITVNALPIAYAGKDTVICAATSIQLGTTAVANNTYSWFPPSTLSNATIANPTASPVAPVTNYIVSVMNSTTGCKNKDTVVVTMLTPVLADAGADAVLCLGESVQIGSSALPDMIYSWSPSIGLSDTTVSNPLATPQDTITYVLTVTDSLGCGPALDSVTIIVHPLPNVYAGVDDTITLGSSTQLSAAGGIQYTWSPVTGLSNWGIFNPIANPTVTTNYIVSATDVYGCTNTDTIKIMVVKPDLWIPQGFTPDHNGHNDVLYVHGEGIRNFEFGIFDRWGARVFFTTDIKQGWDGTRDPIGEIMPQGAYVYFIKGVMSDGTWVDVNGMVNLIR